MLVPTVNVAPLAGDVTAATGGKFTVDAFTVNAIDTLDDAFWLSFAVSVIVCVPMPSDDVVSDAPVPSVPAMLLLHTSDAPDSVPSSTSTPAPTKETLVPCTTIPPVVGAEIATLGD